MRLSMCEWARRDGMKRWRHTIVFPFNLPFRREIPSRSVSKFVDKALQAIKLRTMSACAQTTLLPLDWATRYTFQGLSGTLWVWLCAILWSPTMKLNAVVDLNGCSVAITQPTTVYCLCVHLMIYVKVRLCFACCSVTVYAKLANNKLISAVTTLHFVPFLNSGLCFRVIF